MAIEGDKIVGTMIKAVVFDVGGVIYTNEGGSILEQIADFLGISFIDLQQEYFKHNHLANVENVPWEDVVVKTVQVFNDDKEAEAVTRALVQEHRSKKVLNTELLNLFILLRKADFKVGIISNAGTHLRERLERDGITSLVDAIVISGEVGHQKPHKEIFEILFDMLDLQPGEVAFVDDSYKSLEKAGEIGYTPIAFTTNEKLTADLKSLGIEF